MVLVIRDQALSGLVTDRDLVVRAVTESMSPNDPVGPLSSENLVGVQADAAAAEAARLMRAYAVRRLPVVEDDQIAGVVSLSDLAMDQDTGPAPADVSSARRHS